MLTSSTSEGYSYVFRLLANPGDEILIPAPSYPLFDHLTVAVATRALCRDLKLTVATGELWAVLGCNGSGKTTLLHTLAGLAMPAAGEVEVDGKIGRNIATQGSEHGGFRQMKYSRRAWPAVRSVVVQTSPERAVDNRR